ncbi:hypothetical protein Q8A67_003057 [Cirrhinus molitorella]|uniref:Uncharacterized protein n=1 Tax=Cirrhinus molitorella TaxID=172907 RepID=A0AA88Q2G8_9TELE|nr:hypothetical protein Q8A67_003057 [Cirrhinus molitorella]
MQSDSNSGARKVSQTNDSAQESMNYTSKKNEKGLGNNGRDPLKERTNYFCKEKVEGQSKSHLQQRAEGQSHTFHFRYKFKKHTVVCDTSKTVLEALNTNKIFKKIKKTTRSKKW